MRYCRHLLFISLVMAGSASSKASVAECPAQIETRTVKNAFEVISVTQDDPTDRNTIRMARVEVLPDGFEARHLSIRALLAFTYHVNENQIEGGPAWIRTDSYSIDARVGESMMVAFRYMESDRVRTVRQKMLENLFAERFHVVARCESRERPVYAVTVSKGGIRMRRSAPRDAYENGLKTISGEQAGRNFVGYRFGVGSVEIPSQAGTVEQLVQRFNQNPQALYLDRRIVDRTGLGVSQFDFDLKFTVPWKGRVPEENEPVDFDVLDHDGPSTLAESLEDQLGLTLIRTTGAVDFIKIESIERPFPN